MSPPGILAKYPLTLLSILLFSGCAQFESEPTVPGLTVTEPVTLSTILTATKCELSKVLLHVESNFADSGFRIYDGTVTVTANTTIVDSQGGKLAAVIPIGIFTFESNIGAAIADTGVQEVTTVLKVFIPGDKEHRKAGIPYGVNTAICDEPILSNIDTNGFVSEGLIAQFQELLSTPLNGMAPHHPPTRMTNTKLTAKFTVDYKPEGGVSIKAPFSSKMNVETLTPEFNSSVNETNTHSIVIEFPHKGGEDPEETRRTLDCKENIKSGERMCIERIYQEERDQNRFNDYQQTESFKTYRPQGVDPNTLDPGLDTENKEWLKTAPNAPVELEESFPAPR